MSQPPNEFVNPTEKTEAIITKAAPQERTEAANEATKLLNTADSLPVLREGAAPNPSDSIQPLALVDHGQELPPTEHLLHNAHGHGPGHHHGANGSGDQTVASSTDTTAQKPALGAEAINDPAMMALLAKENPGLAAQLGAQNLAMALQLAQESPGLALQLATQNPGLAPLLAAQNPALAAQFEAQGLISKKAEA
jgi:hypothetical protein